MLYTLVLAIPEKRQGNSDTGRKGLVETTEGSQESSDEENDCIRCYHLPWACNGKCIYYYTRSILRVVTQQKYFR